VAGPGGGGSRGRLRRIGRSCTARGVSRAPSTPDHASPYRWPRSRAKKSSSRRPASLKTTARVRLVKPRGGTNDAIQRRRKPTRSFAARRSQDYYRDKIEIPVLTGLSMDVKAGRVPGPHGPSGSGKITLLTSSRASTRRRAARSGWRGFARRPEAHKLAAWRARNVGFHFPALYLIPVLTRFKTWSYRSSSPN